MILKLKMYLKFSLKELKELVGNSLSHSFKKKIALYCFILMFLSNLY